MPIQRAAPKPATLPKTSNPASKGAADKGSTAKGKTPTNAAPAAGWVAASATSRHERQARQEWDRAPRVREWSNSPIEQRALELEPRMTPAGAVSNKRPFTFDEWMAFRVPQLKRNEPAPGDVPSWR